MTPIAQDAGVQILTGGALVLHGLRADGTFASALRQGTTLSDLGGLRHTVGLDLANGTHVVYRQT